MKTVRSRLYIFKTDFFPSELRFCLGERTMFWSPWGMRHECST